VQKSKRIRNFRALAKVEAYLNKVGTSERTKAVIEPRLSDQWFLKMEDLVKPAKAVLAKLNCIQNVLTYLRTLAE
jgi:valyl-tRNA synthetase